MSDPIKLVTYNILDGAMGRLDPVYETLGYLSADVSGLCEADDPQGVQYIADKLGVEALIAESPTGPHHVAMLTRRPVVSMTNLGVAIPSLTRAAMSSIVDFDGTELRIVVVHLEAHFENESTRFAELNAILDHLDRDPRPTVIMGDLNACGPDYPLDAGNLPPHRRQQLKDHGGKLDHDVVNRLIEAGYVDAYHQKHPDEPQPTFTTGYPALRLDYIWLSRALGDTLVDADVETGGFTPYCSDHFPLWTTLRLNP